MYKGRTGLKKTKRKSTAEIERRDFSQFGPDDLLTDIEAANFLRIKPHTLRVWRSARRHTGLRFVRVGSLIRYRYADLKSFVEANTQGTAA